MVGLNNVYRLRDKRSADVRSCITGASTFRSLLEVRIPLVVYDFEGLAHRFG